MALEEIRNEILQILDQFSEEEKDRVLRLVELTFHYKRMMEI